MISKKDIQVFEEKHRILIQDNECIYLLPHPVLREYISNYTITFPTKENMPDSYTIMPHGSATLVVSIDTKNLFIKLLGPMTKPYLVGNNLSEMLVIVEFQPAGLYALTGVNQSELTDKTISFEAVNPTLSKLVSETIERAGSVYELVSGLDILLLENMYATYHPQLGFVFQSVISCAGNISVKKLSEDIYYSERQLNNIFNQHVGASTKSFARLVRMNAACRLLQNGQNSIAMVSELTGFHDPSHFVHDFKSICSITPQSYRDNISDFYNEIAKFSKYN